jgi:hypothetical protein
MSARDVVFNACTVGTATAVRRLFKHTVSHTVSQNICTYLVVPLPILVGWSAWCISLCHRRNRRTYDSSYLVLSGRELTCWTPRAQSDSAPKAAAKKNTSVSLLDLKRANNIAITLSRCATDCDDAVLRSHGTKHVTHLLECIRTSGRKGQDHTWHTIADC